MITSDVATEVTGSEGIQAAVRGLGGVPSVQTDMKNPKEYTYTDSIYVNTRS